ncbi:MAG: sulfotransferase domain-containing protein [Chitinophagaceae bacterium]
MVRMQEYSNIVIVTTARSGSNYLYTLLSSHTEIFCEGEIFNKTHLKKKHHPLKVYLIEQFPFWYLRHRIKVSETKKKPIYGFKLFPAQLKHDLDSVLPQLIQRNFKIIYLVRLNKISQIISYLVADQQAEWVVHAKQPKTDTPITLNTNKVVRIVAYYQKVWQMQESAMKKYKGLELVYEHDLASPEMIVSLSQKVSDYLSIPNELLRSKMMKTDTRSDAERIVNLPDVLRELRRFGLNNEVDYYLKAQKNVEN